MHYIIKDFNHIPILSISCFPESSLRQIENAEIFTERVTGQFMHEVALCK